MFYFSYDGKPIIFDLVGTYFSGFDPNEWQGKQTENLKISGTTIVHAALPEPAKVRVADAFDQARADQIVIKKVFHSYAAAHPEIFPALFDEETGKQLPVDIKSCIRPQTSKPDPNKPNRATTPFFTFNMTVPSEKVEADARKRKLRPVIIVNGVPIRDITRGEFYEKVKGRKYLCMSTAELQGFRNASGTFMTLSGRKIMLQELLSQFAPTEAEVKEMIESAAMEFESMGLGPAKPSGNSEQPDPLMMGEFKELNK